MSFIVIKVKNEGNIPVLKKLINAVKEKANIISNAEYQDKIMSVLIDEGLKSEIVPEELVKKEFKKRGLNY